MSQIDDTRLAGRIRAFAARRVLIGVCDSARYRKVLLLVFSSDGSIFVQWPYFRTSTGLLASLTFLGGRAEGNYDLGSTGKATSHHVKFAHHVDGEAHFSQDGRVRTQIRRQSFRLDGPVGQLFQFSIFDPSGFREYPLSESSGKRPEILWTYPSGVPGALVITGKWYHRDQLHEFVPRDVQDIGPHATLVDEATGAERDVVFVGQPTSWQTRSHLLMLTCQAIRVPDGARRPTVLFMGAGDAEDEVVAGQAGSGDGALIAMYPYDACDEQSLIDTIDFQMS